MEDKKQQSNTDSAKTQSPPKGFSLEDDEVVYRSVKLDQGHVGNPFGGAGFPAPMGAQFAPTLQKGGLQNATTPVNAKVSGCTKVDVQLKLVDKTNYSKVVPKDLPPLPFRLEKHTNFAVQGSTQRICSIIGRKIAELGCDFDFKPEKCKWKIDFYNGAQRCNLNVVVFKSKDKYIIEFQRREGDMISFLKIYREVYEVCIRNQLMVDRSIPVSSKRKSPSTSNVQVSASIMKEVVCTILEMLSSKFLEIQQQGIQASMSLAIKDSCRKYLAPIVGNLLNLTRSNSSSIRRAAAAVLSSLSVDITCMNALVELENWDDIVRYAKGESKEERELQRESMLVFSKLSKFHGKKLQNCTYAGEMWEFLKHCDTISDARTKFHAFSARDTLKDAGIFVS